VAISLSAGSAIAAGFTESLAALLSGIIIAA